MRLGFHMASDMGAFHIARRGPVYMGENPGSNSECVTDSR